MIYEVIKDENTFEIDDNVFFDNQKESFRTAFVQSAQNNVSEFGNCSVLVFDNGKIVITPKIEDNE